VSTTSDASVAVGVETADRGEAFQQPSAESPVVDNGLPGRHGLRVVSSRPTRTTASEEHAVQEMERAHEAASGREYLDAPGTRFTRFDYGGPGW